jgi:hypothetical protein
MTRRLEFTRKTKLARWLHAGGRCEILWDGKRCDVALAPGRVEYHHDIEAESGGDNSFGNARATCVQCHKLLTRPFIKAIRKADRSQAAHLNLKPAPAVKIKSRGFTKPDKPARTAKPVLKPRAMFKNGA